VTFTRISQGRSPFFADRNHFHHNLIAFGFLHQESVLIIYAIQAGLLLAAVTMRFHSDWLLLGGYLLFAALVTLAYSRAVKTGWRLKRYDLIDSRIIGRLRMIKRRGSHQGDISAVRSCVLLLLFITVLLAQDSPPVVSIVCAILPHSSFRLALQAEVAGRTVRTAIYLAVPFAVYLSDASLADITGNPWPACTTSLWDDCATHSGDIEILRRSQVFTAPPWISS
jgi:UDP-GlcNAc:undecaprenyl-phosphate GlcNAc-1-phosphate transferase